jgi:pilus assembly protein CpaB
MSVKVNEVIGVAGFVTPGTRVDVLVTVRQDKDSRSRVVVQNVQVLTAGAKYDDPEGRKQGKPIPSTVVTLMVKPADAEKIALASIQGQIMLALRNPLDKREEPTPGTSVAMLMGPSAPIALPATPAPVHRTARVVAPPPPPPAPRAIEVFKATKRINRGETER